VFSKSGAAGLSAIAAISRRVCSIAASRAGLKEATWTLSKAGTPPYGPVHRASKGFSGWALAAGVLAGVPAEVLLGMELLPS
jgi:hypothetical protein